MVNHKVTLCCLKYLLSIFMLNNLVFCIFYMICRCLICTNAFGIGVEIPEVDLVIHWGAPTSILQYLQEAHLPTTKMSMVRSEKGMVKLCKSDDCIRQIELH